MTRTPEMDAFVEEAKSVDILDGFSRCGQSVRALKTAGTGPMAEQIGPCPACGGKDRFSLSPKKQVFNCRGFGGGDVVSMAMHVTGAGFLDVCEILLGRDRPGLEARDERERARSRLEAEARIAAQRAEADRVAAQREAEAAAFRSREWARCAEDWHDAAPFAGSAAEAYLAARGLPMPDPAYVRCHPMLGYFHEGAMIHRGPAMLVRFLVPGQGGWQPIGLHRTWIDLDAAPKFRPAIADPKSGEALASKKMRGSKKGGLLPVLGRLSTARRMVAGEGIETVLGWIGREGARDDTFYCASGDLGNLAGKALDRIRHPSLKATNKAGRTRAVQVQGETPDLSSGAMPVPDTIDELLILGDGDSERVMTRAAVHRACARHAREGRAVTHAIAPPGLDWASFGQEAA